ncbi:MAG: transposase, partial [Methylococcales bacterium]
MARLPRIIVPGQPQHVIVRGNNRTDIFRADADYRYYLEILQAACKKHACQIHAYVLMSNHVHLLITPSAESSLSKTMQMLGRYYVQHFNYCYQRTGTLWEGRYKATMIDSENYLLTCMRYIEMNPVRAGLVSEPAQYAWSSYHCNALGQTDPLVTPYIDYLRLGLSDAERQQAYRALFKEVLADSCLAEIREATNKAWVLGSADFKETMQTKLARRIAPASRGGDRKSRQFKINRI